MSLNFKLRAHIRFYRVHACNADPTLALFSGFFEEISRKALIQSEGFQMHLHISEANRSRVSADFGSPTGVRGVRPPGR
jgi:hypothetical protein